MVISTPKWTLAISARCAGASWLAVVSGLSGCVMVGPFGHGQPYVLRGRGPNGPEPVCYARRRRWSENFLLARRRMSESWQPPQPQPSHPQQAQPPLPQSPNPYGYPPPVNPYAAPPPNPYMVPTYGYPPPSPYLYAPPQPRHHGRNLLIGRIVVALVVAVVAVAAQHPRSSTTAAQPTTPAQTNQANQPNPTAQ